MSASVRSQMALIVLMLLIRCVSIALAVSFASLANELLIICILSRSIQMAYMSASAEGAARPVFVISDPISTRSGSSRFLTASPSARNSGMDDTSKDKVGGILKIYLSHVSTLSKNKLWLEHVLWKTHHLLYPSWRPNRNSVLQNHDKAFFCPLRKVCNCFV